MDLRTQLLLEHSKSNSDKIVQWVGADQERFDELFELFLAHEYRVTQRAAQPIRYCVFNHPQLMKGKWDRLISNLDHPNVHVAVVRNTVSLLEHVDYPDEFMGQVADKCFGYLEDPKVAVAIRAFSMGVLLKIVQKEPELKEELKVIIEEHLPYGTGGFKSRGQKILKAIDKIR